MTAQLLDGKAIAKQIRSEVAMDVAELVSGHNVVPMLAAVLVGDDPASQVYVRNKQRDCEKAGLGSKIHRLSAATSQAELLELIDQLNADSAVHGILVQLPLPKGLHEQPVLDAISPLKDVDAFHPENVGLLVQGRPRFLPCTPHGVQQLLHRYEIPASGKHVVVLGRSDIVGKPLSVMLGQKDSELGSTAVNATVTLCHSRTRDLSEITRTADILVAAIGKAEFVTPDMIKPGAVVVDVGINRVNDRLVGDVAFEPVCQVASFVTPVPGGVGPLTRAMLLRNTLAAAQLQAY